MDIETDLSKYFELYLNTNSITIFNFYRIFQFSNFQTITKPKKPYKYSEIDSIIPEYEQNPKIHNIHKFIQHAVRNCSRRSKNILNASHQK